HAAAVRPEHQRHLRSLHQRGRGVEPAPRQLHAAWQRRSGPERLAGGSRRRRDAVRGPARAAAARRRVRPPVAHHRAALASMSAALRAHAHDGDDKVGVLLVNLGTPEAPTTPALRRYLAQFLSDPRVVEIPRALWWLILHGVILRVRPRA